MTSSNESESTFVLLSWCSSLCLTLVSPVLLSYIMVCVVFTYKQTSKNEKRNKFRIMWALCAQAFGIWVLFPLPPSLLKWGGGGSFCFWVSNCSGTRWFLCVARVLFVLGLRYKACALFRCLGLEAQRAAFTQRTLLQCSLFAQHQSTSFMHMSKYVHAHICTHIVGYVYVFDLSSSFPDVLHPDRLLVGW